ncbi:cell adhesion molecule CEACAM1-like isoform X2 [Crassostrea virginica]
MQFYKATMLEKRYIFFSLCLSLHGPTTEGQQYNLIGSSEYAVLGEAFTWTCDMFIPPDQTVNAVTFLRNDILCGSIGLLRDQECITLSSNPRYTYGCESQSIYILTIPAENMTEYEQGSVWRCENFADDTFKSSDATLTIANTPYVLPLAKQHFIEGGNLLVTCNATQGNPSSTAIFWTKSNDPGFRQTGITLRLPNIHRNSSGIYKCTAENTYSNREKGTNSRDMVIDVLYKPVIKNKIVTIVNNTENAELIREIDSNPLSNISWYNRAELLDTQTSVKIANFTIKNASCVDTKNFTLSASNVVQRNVTSMVELIVNCKPEIKDDDITIEITSASRNVSFSTTVIAYPEPRYRLMYKNGTINTEMKVNVHKNALNNFTIHCEQQFVREMDSETYSLKVDNFLGSSTIFVHISKQEKPSSPIIIESVCKGTSARIKWKSSFDGGPVHSFFIVALSDALQIVG